MIVATQMLAGSGAIYPLPPLSDQTKTWGKERALRSLN